MLFVGCNDGKTHSNSEPQEEVHNHKIEAIPRITFKELKTEFDSVIFPVVYDGSLFMSVSTFDDEEKDNRLLVEYDLKSNQYKTIFESEYSEAFVQGIQVNENWVVWQDLEAWGCKDNIWILNRKTNKKKKINSISTNAPSYTVPCLIDDYIAWIEEEKIVDDKIKGSVRLYNCNSGKYEKIANLEELGAYNIILTNQGSKLLWTDTIDGKSYYFVYDIYNKKMIKKKVDLKYAMHPKFVGENIFSVELDSEIEKRFISCLKDNKKMEIDMPLKFYNEYRNNLIAYISGDIVVCSINEDLTLNIDQRFPVDLLDNYYIFNNSSFVIVKNNSDNNEITLLIAE